jgi:hypothetical protein
MREGRRQVCESRQKFVRRISSVHAHAQPYNPMNLVLSFLSVMRGSCARQPSGVLLCVFPPIATWMQISLLRDPSCSWQCASSSYLHHESASVFVRVSPGLNLFYTSTAPCKFLLLSSFVP